MTERSSRFRPSPHVAAAGVTVILWASAFVGIRHAASDFAAGSLALGRLAIGAVCLGLLALRTRPAWPSRRHASRLLVCGVAWFGIYNVVLNEAEHHVPAGISAMLVNIGPILIAILAGYLLKEGFPRNLFAGGVVALAGASAIGLATSSASQADALGIALCLAAALAYAIGVVAQKPLLGEVAPVMVTFVACVIGAAVCLPFAPQLWHDLGHAHASSVAVLVYLGVFPTAVAFTTWAYALRSTSAGRMGATTYIVPPLAVALGWILLGEVPPVAALGGGALCLTGVWLARRGGTKPVVEPAES